MSCAKNIGNNNIVLEIPPPTKTKSDVDLVKEIFLEQAIARSMIADFGGNAKTTLDELHLPRFDPNFNEKFRIGQGEQINHLQSNLVIQVTGQYYSQNSFVSHGEYSDNCNLYHKLLTHVLLLDEESCGLSFPL